MNPNIWIMSFSHIASDPRVMRQIRALDDAYSITVFGYGPPINGLRARLVSLGDPPRTSLLRKLVRVLRLLTHRYELAYWNEPRVRLLRSMARREGHPSLVLANDIETLPVALRRAIPSPVVLDAHEFSPGQFADRRSAKWLMLPLKRHLCQGYIHKATAMMTVAPGIAREYGRLYGVKPTVVSNAPAYEPLDPSPVDSHRIRMIHHGAAQPARKIEAMIDVMSLTDDRFVLDLMLVPSDRRYYKRIAASVASLSNVRLVRPVPMDNIVSTLNQYDLGLYLLQPYSFNGLHALPNKFFEFVQARLAVAIGPSPEMAYYVKRYDIGMVSSDFTPQRLADLLNRVTRSQIVRWKQSASVVARDINADSNARLIRTVVADAHRRHEL